MQEFFVRTVLNRLPLEMRVEFAVNMFQFNGKVVYYIILYSESVPRDGQWSDWSNWDCGQATDMGCGTSPLEVRRRVCNNPYPLNNGKECQGDNVETR